KSVLNFNIPLRNMFHNPELHKHLKAATKEASDSLTSLVNKLLVVPTQEKVDRKLRKEIKTELSAIVEEIIPNQPSFKSCVEYLVKDVDINQIIEELARELMPISTNDVEMKEEDVIEMLQELVKEDVEINEVVEDVSSRLQKRIKNKVNDKAEDKVWNRIGEYLNCIGFTEWNDFREFNEQTFDEYYAEYEQFLYSNLPVKYQIVASLENFNYILPSSDIILSGNTRIVSKRKKHIEGYLFSAPTYDIDEDEIEERHYKLQFLSNFWLEIDCEIEKGKIPSECKEYIEHTSLE
ncbi:unnamed protein product, partial [marine sediment metagenome]